MSGQPLLLIQLNFEMMNTNLLKNIDVIYKETSRMSYKTIEQCQSDYEKQLNTVAQAFEINHLEAIFLTAIIINNTEYKNCQLEDIANQLNVSKFEIMENLQSLFSLESKNLISINEPEEIAQEKRLINRAKYPIDILNKSFIITKTVEKKLLSS